MLHPEHHVPRRLIAPAEAAAAHEALQRAIERSREQPYRTLALAAGVLEILVLALCSGVARLFGVRPDAVDRELAACFVNVPEMALHKKIELDALGACRLEGEGIDIGCGSGHVGGLLIRHRGATSLHGLDLNPGVAELVIGNGYRDFRAADIAATAFAGATFDYAISICVIEHVTNLAGALREIGRILKPGAPFMFTTPAPRYRASTIVHRWWSLLGRPERAAAFAHRCDLMAMHHNVLDEAGWRDELARAGFATESIQGIFPDAQYLLYDALNWQVYLPTFYFSDKLQTFAFRHPRFAALARWAIAGVTAAAASRRSGPATHWLITARRQSEPTPGADGSAGGECP